MVQVRKEGGRWRPRHLPPAECFGIKYRFNYLLERFMALRKLRGEKTRSDVCTKSVFLGKLIMGMSIGNFLNLFSMVICFACAYKDISWLFLLHRICIRWWIYTLWEWNKFLFQFLYYNFVEIFIVVFLLLTSNYLSIKILLLKLQSWLFKERYKIIPLLGKGLPFTFHTFLFWATSSMFVWPGVVFIEKYKSHLCLKNKLIFKLRMEKL